MCPVAKCGHVSECGREFLFMNHDTQILIIVA